MKIIISTYQGHFLRRLNKTIHVKYLVEFVAYSKGSIVGLSIRLLLLLLLLLLPRSYYYYYVLLLLLRLLLFITSSSSSSSSSCQIIQQSIANDASLKSGCLHTMTTYFLLYYRNNIKTRHEKAFNKTFGVQQVTCNVATQL